MDRTTLHGGHDGNHSDLTNQNSAIQHRTRRDIAWVNNLSSTPLTQEQEKALSNGPNYAIVPRVPPIGEYLTAIENVCNQLGQGKGRRIGGRSEDSIEEDPTIKAQHF